MKYENPIDIINLAQQLIALCQTKGIRLSTVESCTGGLLSGCLTDVPGSSEVFDRGFITYSNEAKHEEVNVSNESLVKFGAVSGEVACEMCAGVLSRTGVGAAVSVTGIAGPGGATDDKPVGLVYIGIATTHGTPVAHRYVFPGDRQEVRSATISAAIELLIRAVAEIRSTPGVC